MTLSNDSAERIPLLLQAAKRNGSLVSVRELSRLLPERASEAELAEAVSSLSSLSSRFELRAGYLTERSHEPDEGLCAETVNRKTAEVNMRCAFQFASFFRPNPFKMVAVSGSTSYGSASRSKDLDLFCVAPAGRMWVSLSLGLLAARAFGLIHHNAPNVCLSCIMDEDYARSRFASERDPLFARDAIETKVVKGIQTYRSLMSVAGWISRLYPLAYYVSPGAQSDAGFKEGASSFGAALNRFLLSTVGRYMRLKSTLLNRSLRASGRSGDVFVVRVGEDHLIYESKQYSDLRREYQAVLSSEIMR